MDMDEEMRLHLDGLIERNIAAGLSPRDARFAAMKTFGGVEQLKEQCRDERRFRWLEEGMQDLRHAMRLLAKSPGFTVITVLSLVIGIGANTAVFSLCNEVLLKTLPVANPQELVVLRYRGNVRVVAPRWMEGNGDRLCNPATGQSTTNAFSPTLFKSFRDRGSNLADLFAFAPLPQLSVLIDGSPEVSPLSQIVSGNYHASLGVPPTIGRMLVPADDRPEAAPVAVISYRYWQRRFGCDLAVAGKLVWLNNVPVTIVGVMPPDFLGTLQVGESPDYTVPLAMASRLRPDKEDRFDLQQPSHWWLRIMGRLGPGATPEQLRMRLDGYFRQAVLKAYPETQTQPELPQLVVESGDQGLDEARRSYRPSLLILSGIAGLVLLIACVNVANLLLTRAIARRREIAVRLALGASRGRIIRQLLAESLLLALLGAGLGALFAWWGKDLLLMLRPAGGNALVLDLYLDGRVLGFTTVIAVATGLLFGLAPALRATRLELKVEFQAAGCQRSAGGFAPAQGLIIVQVALSFLLLVGAGLFIRTLHNLQAVDVGFNRSHLLLFQIDAVGAGRNRDQVANLYRRLHERIAAVPGVRASTYSLQPLLGGQKIPGDRSVLSYPEAPGQKERRIPVAFNAVGPRFFSTFEIPILIGRDLGAHEETPGIAAIVINQTLAQTGFGGADVLGRRTSVGEIVGVVGDTIYGDLTQPVIPTAYIPFSQARAWSNGSGEKANFAVRTLGDPLLMLPTVRRAVRDIDPKLPLIDVRTPDIELDRLLQQERLFARLSGLFGLLALALVCVGLYGLMSYTVLRRTTEIGIRLALGALPGTVRWMILRESLGLVGAGLSLGLVATTVIVPHIAPQLHGLSPNDPLIYSAVGLLLLAVGPVTCWIPANRASRIDAMAALRCE